jgi:hypothetical protein
MGAVPRYPGSGSMRFLLSLLILAAGGAATAPAALSAAADTCGVPSATPLWVDFGGHDAPIPAKPGVVIAVASGTDVPAQFRAAGAATVIFDLNLNKRIGTTTNPADPSVIDARAKSFFDYAVQVTGCQTPVIAENELAGAQTPTPWTPNNAQYRANVLQFLTDLTGLGATPLLSIANPPFTASPDAALWWQQVSKVAILLRQVYFTSPNLAALYALGPTAASVSMRQSLRSLVNHLTRIGIPAGRIALEMQLTTSPGLGQRAGLDRLSWFEMVKLEALAAKFVATQFRLGGIWSWGWATFNPNASPDADKAAAACVWLWTRDQSLCDAPTAAGEGFDASLTEGQLDVPAGVRCLTSAGQISRNAVARFTALTGDPGYAASALLEQLTLASEQKVAYPDLLSAQRAVIKTGFSGDRSRYWAAVRAAKLNLDDARAILAARLARDEVESSFRPPAPSQRTIVDFLTTYRAQQAIFVTTTKPAPWLGGRASGWAIQSLAPADLFTLSARGTIDTPDGTFDVTPSGTALPLGLLPRVRALAAARETLDRLTRETIYREWLRAKETELLKTASCLNDQVPAVGETDLSSFVPFLFPAA